MPTPAPAGNGSASSTPPEFDIRSIAEHDEFRACVTLQKDTWGEGFSDVVPASMIQITAKMGGVALGAFAPDGRLIGFVYGITGLRNGEIAHWSHMLAVRREARDLGIGRQLKLRQKEILVALGVTTMYWTFDPLVARNAHLNLNRLGARVAEYVPDMYGASDSELHQLGTDRFVVRWDLNGDGPHTAGPATSDDTRVVLGAPESEDPSSLPAGRDVEVLIPSDIEALEARSFEEALGWRHSTRQAFSLLLGGNYDVTGFIPGPAHSRYVISRTEPAK